MEKIRVRIFSSLLLGAEHLVCGVTLFQVRFMRPEIGFAQAGVMRDIGKSRLFARLLGGIGQSSKTLSQP
jgi:hypothetical protein